VIADRGWTRMHSELYRNMDAETIAVMVLAHRWKLRRRVHD
jgi:hypothetical protein